MCGRLTREHIADSWDYGMPTPREMAEQLRRLYRERDWTLLNAVCHATTRAVYAAARNNQDMGISVTSSGCLVPL